MKVPIGATVCTAVLASAALGQTPTFEGTPIQTVLVEPCSCELGVPAKLASIARAAGAAVSSARLIGPFKGLKGRQRRKAGFAATRLPARFRSRLAHPRDDFIVPMTGDLTIADEIEVSVIFDELNSIVEGRYYRMLNVLDEFSYECLAIRRGCRCQDRLHRAGQPLGERLHRELQRPPSR
jgi:hypothetical protein